MKTDERYERVYCEARDVLFRRGKRLGQPRVASDSIRRCAVSGVPLTDLEVFIEAWGQELADEIVRPTLTSCCKTENCQECQRLWQEYWVVAERYSGLLKADLTARDVHDASALTEPGKQRGRARSLLLGHAADHHHAWLLGRQLERAG